MAFHGRRSDFFNLYRHGFARVALATPLVRIGDPMANAAATLTLLQQAAKRRRSSRYSPSSGSRPTAARTCSTSRRCCALRGSARLAARALEDLPIAAFVGLPVVVDGLLYNCAALHLPRQLLGLVPKTYLPNYREFYELRQFTPGGDVAKQITLAGQSVPFGSLLFRSKEQPGLVLFAEICEDLWVPLAALLLCGARRRHRDRNLSASNVVVGKDQYRGSSQATSRRAASPPISTARPARANPPPTSPGTATRWPSRTARSWPSRSATRANRSSRSPTWTSSACRPTACARTPSANRCAGTRPKSPGSGSIDFSLP
jgi:hypothetical protein